MNRMPSVLFILLALIAGCDGSSSHGSKMMGGGGMMDNVVITGGRAPQETRAEQLLGFQQAQTTCSQCHIMPNPNQHTRDEWPGVITRMMDNIKNFKRTMPSDSELKIIVDYYVTKAG